MRKRLEYAVSLQTYVKGFLKVLNQEAINGRAYSLSKSTDSTPTKNKDDSSKAVSTPQQSSQQRKMTPICLHPRHKGKGYTKFLQRQ